MRLLEDLDAEHGPLTARVSRLRVIFSAVTEGEKSLATVQSELRDHLDWLRDALLEHFGREEECFFPYLRMALPDMQPEVDRLESAHDQICGALSRMHYLTARWGRPFEDGFPHLAHVFERFAESYFEHASGEREVLRVAASRLTAEQRAELVELSCGFG